jgi:uncharacterized membrane protein YkoI
MAKLRARFPEAEIQQWTREEEDGVVLYDIEFRQQGRKFEADIKEDGAIDNWEREIAPRRRLSMPSIVPMGTVSLK